jgi:hypothetical protein
MLKALILIALLGSDDFRTRERAHALVWEGMPYWAPLVEQCENSPDPEVAGRCWYMTEKYLLQLALAGDLRPPGYKQLPLIEKIPHHLGHSFCNWIWWYREAVAIMRPADPSRQATRALVIDMLRRGYDVRFVRDVLSEMARAEYSRTMKRYQPPPEYDPYDFP